MPYNKNILGWMPENDLQVLEKIVEVVPINGNIIEIGSLFGRSSICMAMSVDKSVKIYCVDSFPDSSIQNDCFFDDDVPIINKLYNVGEEFYNNTKDIDNIVMIKGVAPNIDYDFPLIDMLFLDASHSNPNDWNNLCHFVPLIKVGGIVSGHDYSDCFPDIKENVYKLEKLFNNTANLYKNTSLWSIIVTKKVTEFELKIIN